MWTIGGILVTCSDCQSVLYLLLFILILIIISSDTDLLNRYIQGIIGLQVYTELIANRTNHGFAARCLSRYWYEVISSTKIGSRLLLLIIIVLDYNIMEPRVNDDVEYYGLWAR